MGTRFFIWPGEEKKLQFNIGLHRLTKRILGLGKNSLESSRSFHAPACLETKRRDVR